MNRISRRPAVFSKISVKGQTVIPREVRQRLKLKPGDTLRHRMTDDGVLLDKATEAGDDPFVAFSEWTPKPTRRPMVDCRTHGLPSWPGMAVRRTASLPSACTRP
jgi:AbrB family looped-hinge helix DNA binding protein